MDPSPQRHPRLIEHEQRLRFPGLNQAVMEKNVRPLNLAKDIGLPVVASNAGKDHSIGAGLRFYGEVDVAMGLASPRLKEIESGVAIAPVKGTSRFGGVVMHIQLNGQI